MIGTDHEQISVFLDAINGSTVKFDHVLASPTDVTGQMMEKDAMINLIRELTNLLSRDALDVVHVVARIGRVNSDPGIPMPIDLLPESPILSSARLSRYPATGLPYVLTIQPKPAFRPTVSALKAAFGPCDWALTERGMPAECVFDSAGMGHQWTVTMIATSPGGHREDKDNFVSFIALRRDPMTQ